MAAVVVKITGEVDDAAFKKLETTLGRLGIEVENVEKKAAPAFDKLGKSLQDTGDKMAGVGKTMSTHVTAPLAAIGAVSLKVAGDFEQTMNVLQVNSNASEKELKSLRDMAIEFGQKTVFSAGESADAMLELSKGGLAVADIQGGALASTLALAATEGMGLSDAATIVVQAMNTFGLEADQTAKVVDVLAAGAVASTAGVADLAAGLKYVGATAKQFNVPVGATVTALAALNNAGLDSTTAGTSLNRFFLGLTGSTKKAADTIKAMGFEFFNAQGEMKPMEQIIKELEKGMAGLTDQQRAQTLKAVFGVEGMRAGNILLEQGVEGYKKLAAEIDKNGVAQEMADARMKGLKGSLEQLKGSIETAAIAIGTIMAPVVQNLASFVQSLVDKFTGLPTPVQQVIVIIGAAVAAIGPLLFIIGKVTSATGTMMIGFSKVAPMFGTVMTAAKALFTFLMTHPFILIGAAVVALAVLIYKNWDEIKVFLTNAFNAIKDVAIAIWDGIKNAIGGAIEGARNLVDTALDKIKGAFTTVFNGIKDTVLGIFDLVVKGIKGYLNLIIRGVNLLISGLNKINFTLPDWVPGLGGKSFGISIPQIPALAEGGIVTKPTLALIGEAGPEAVVPLSKGGGMGVTIQRGAVQVTINGSADSSTVSSIERTIEEALLRLAREVRYA